MGLRGIILAVFASCLTLFAATQSGAQDTDDNGYIVGYLEEALSSEGFTVKFTDVVGILSSKASVGEITIADSDGVWLRIKTAKIDWTRTALLKGVVRVHELSADSIAVLRQPKRAQSTFVPEATPFRIPDLPVEVDIAAIKVKTLTLGKAVFGQEVALTASAALKLDEIGISATLDADRTSGGVGSVHLGFDLAREASNLDVDFSLTEAENGLIVNALGIDGAPPLSVRLAGAGPLADMAIGLAVGTDQPGLVTGMIRFLESEVGPEVRVRISGQLDQLAPLAYRDFFAGTSVLTAEAVARRAGGYAVSNLHLRTGRLALKGSLATADDGFLSDLHLSGKIAQQDAGLVVLPFGDGQVTLSRAWLELAYGQASGSGWAVDIAAENLASPGLSLRDFRVTATGVSDDLFTSANRSISGQTTLTLAGLDADPSGWLGMLAPDLSANSQFSWRAGEAIKLTAFDATGADFDLRGSGSLSNRRFDGEMQAGVQRLQRFGAAMPQVDLRGAVDIGFSGGLDPLAGMLDGKITLNGRDIATGIVRLDRFMAGDVTLDVGLRRDAEGLSVDALAFNSPALSVRANGQISSENLAIDLRASVADILLISPSLAGKGVLVAGLNGPPEQSVLTARFDAASGESASVSGQIGGDLDLSVAFSGVPIALANEFWPDIGFAGLASGQARVSGAIQAPEIAFDVRGENLKSTLTDGFGIGWFNTSATGNWRQEHLSLARFQLSANGVIDVAGSGGIDIAGATLDLALSGRVPLSLGQIALDPGSALLSGGAGFDLTLKGPFSGPDIVGTGQVLDGGIALPDLNIGVQDIAADIVFAGRSARLTGLAARFRDGGGLQATGVFGLTPDAAMDFSVAVDRIHYSDGDLLSSIASGDISVKGDISGGVQVDGRITPEIVEVSLHSAVATASELEAVNHIAPPRAVALTLDRAGLAKSSAPQTSLADRVFLDLTIDAPRRIFVRGRGLDAELGGALGLSGPISDVRAAGQFSLLRGRLQFLGKRLDLTSGSLSFSGSLDPQIDFVATTTADGMQAVMQLTGLASEPALTLSSDPVLPQDEILARLIFNRSLAKMSVFQIAQLASAVAELSGRSQTDLIENLRRIAGVDNFDIRTSETGATSGAVGKYLDDNLYSEVEVDTEGKTNITINLDLSETLSLQGSVDNEGSGGLGLFFEKDY